MTDMFFDNLGRLTSVQEQGQTGGNTVAEKRVDLAYDAQTRLDQLTRYADLAATDEVARTDYLFDNLGRLTGMDHDDGQGTSIVDHAWTYDDDSHLAGYTNSVDGTSDYTYDATSQLTDADHSYQTDEDYDYDANGNRTNT